MSVAAREWQQAFLAEHARAAGPDFLLVATPGAGKTLAACLAARASGCEQTIVVCPTTALRSQWADAADRVGLHLDPRWRNADGVWHPDAGGVAVTYQQVASAPDLFAHHLARPTFVILDEIHHAGESATWGTALCTAFETATARLALSGTPFSLRRTRDPVRHLRRGAPLCAGLRLRLLAGGRRRRLPPAGLSSARRHAALAGGWSADGRRVRRRAHPARRRAAPAHGDRPDDTAAAADAARRGRAPAEGALGRRRRRRARPLRRPRARAGDSGAAAHDHRREARRRAERRGWRACADRALSRRGDPRDPRWLVAVNMVSEGVDVPLPGDPSLKACAERVEVELRRQVLEEAAAAFDAEPSLGSGQRPDFEALDAEVEPGGMIVAGVHYARDEVDAARRLLRELGQPERALRAVLEFVRRERMGSGPAAVAPAPAREGPARAPTHRRIDEKRRALDRLTRRWAQLRRELDPQYTWPQAQARVNRAMGVGTRTAAGERQLDEGLAFLRAELAKLSDAYPDAAERLRIPGSVDASTAAWRTRRRSADAPSAR